MLYIYIVPPPVDNPYLRTLRWSFDPPEYPSPTEELESVDVDFDLIVEYDLTVPHSTVANELPLLLGGAGQSEDTRILHDLHEACGFDPSSTESAEYLGLPLFDLHFQDQVVDSLDEGQR